MKLSIIVPFHRGIHFLEDCFASIRDQGITDFETVLVLDHTREDISKIIDDYLDLNIKITELNDQGIEDRDFGKGETSKMLKGYSGVAAARNLGIKMAEGEYVYFLDSDDYILSGTLPYLLKETIEQQADLSRTKKTCLKEVFIASQEELKREEAEITTVRKMELSVRIKSNILKASKG